MEYMDEIGYPALQTGFTLWFKGKDSDQQTGRDEKSPTGIYWCRGLEVGEHSDDGLCISVHI